MAASYIFRLDDITPEMRWKPFRAVMKLFEEHEIVPLLGVVPDNRDPSLHHDPPARDFWSVLAGLAEGGKVELAQHGYTHVLHPKPGAGLLGAPYGFKERTEFAGLDLEQQAELISRGRAIMRANGLPTTYWMAPSHSFDDTTLDALVRCGFTAVTDGIALFPYVYRGLTFVPQQYARGRWLPFGVETICLHTNNLTDRRFSELETFVRKKLEFVRFSTAVKTYRQSFVQQAANSLFEPSYRWCWTAKSFLADARRRLSSPVTDAAPV